MSQPRFDTLLGHRRGPSEPTAAQVNAAADALQDLCDIDGYRPHAEAVLVLRAGSVDRAAQALADFCGLPEQDFSDHAAAALDAARRAN